MNRKKMILSAMLLLVLAAATLGYTAHPIYVFDRSRLAGGVSRRDLEKIYDVNFVMDRIPSGNMLCYAPQYRPAGLDDVRLYSGLFGMHGQYYENEAAYYFYDPDTSERLVIYKHINRLRYEKKISPPEVTSAKLDDNGAIKKAMDFFDSKLLHVGYDEAEVSCDGEYYEVKFINRLGNIHSYAFNNIVVLDKYGNVTGMDYYYLSYDKLGSSEIISMREAFLDLPSDLPEGSVNLTGARLVYFYEDSIVQPGYLFEGELLDSDGRPKSFQSFVKAAVFG